MKKYFLFFVMCIGLGACSKDNDLGPIEALSPDYPLPYGKSSADDRIVEIYDSYGSYILYEYSLLDFQYGLSSSYLYTLPDPEDVGDMIDLLEDIWFDFYPTEFHKKYMPYKIFLAKTLERNQNGRIVPIYLAIGEECIALGYCSDTLRKMSNNMKLQFKNDLQTQLWNNWCYDTIVKFPEEFFMVSDYSRKAEEYDEQSPDFTRTRGFVETNIGLEWSAYINYPATTLSKEMDLYSYMSNFVTRTEDEWAADLEYPLVKKKYDILREYFSDMYNVDIQHIGNCDFK